jgi:hypothetical protein
MTVDGGTGVDALRAYDDGDVHAPETGGNYGSNGGISATTISGFDMPGAGVVYADFATFSLALGVGADKVFVDSTHAGYTRIDTGDDASYLYDPASGKTVLDAGDGTADGADGGQLGAVVATRTDGIIGSQTHQWIDIASLTAGFTGATNGDFVQILLPAGVADPNAINHNAGQRSRIFDPVAGEVVEVTNATLAYDFTVTDANKGLYDLDVRAAGLDGDSDSFWVQVLRETSPGTWEPVTASITDNLLAGNNESLAVFTSVDGVFGWLDAGLWNLTGGRYRVQITMRESGVAIDEIRFGRYAQNPGDDQVNVRSIGGIVEINGGSGDDRFNVNYLADGVTQTELNGIGTMATDQYTTTGAAASQSFQLTRTLAASQLLSVVANGQVLPFDRFTVDVANSRVTVTNLPAGALVTITYLVTVLELHGQLGSDLYTVGLAGDGFAVIDLIDKRASEAPDLTG